MASTTGQKQHAVDKLNQFAQQADFIQLVRLVERFVADEDIKIAYHATPALNFPIHDIEALVYTADKSQEKLTVLLRFMNLIGDSGVLPQHYNETLLQRIDDKDTTLLAFLDLFHDRLYRLFFETKMVSRFYLAEEQQQPHSLPNLLTAITGQQDKQCDWQTYFAGILGHQARSIEGLVTILQQYFGLAITVKSYTPVWYRLETQERTVLGNINHHVSLGATLGKRVTLVQERFTLHIKVDDYKTFTQCLPGSRLLATLHEMVTAYCGSACDYDVAVSITKKQLPKTVISREKTSLLGWNSRLSQSTSEQLQTIHISAHRCQQVTL
jgi:type VI secretion system protein ImpH